MTTLHEPDQPQVLASPVVKVARNLSAIVDLTASLRQEIVNKANDPLMPGGLAMVALAGVADPNDWADLVDAAETLHLAHPEQYPAATLDDEDEDWEPPFQTIRYWSTRWRRAHNMAYVSSPTLTGEISFIRWALGWAWDNEPNWDAFAADISRSRSRLESILYAGSRPERTRIVCDRDACETNPRLIKIYAARKPDHYVCPQCHTTQFLESGITHCPKCEGSPALMLRYGSDPEEDKFKCPACKARFDRKALKEAHAKQLRSAGAEKFVNLVDAIGTLKVQGRAEPTIRKWLRPPLEHVDDYCTECGLIWDPNEYPACPAQDEDGEECGGALEARYTGDANAVIESYCDLATHKVYVWWPDMWRLHLTTQRRQRTKAAA